MVEAIRLQNIVTGAEFNIDMLTTQEYVLSSVDWGTIASAHHSYKYVNQVGVYVTGTSLETRSVEIIGWVVGETEEVMTQRKAMLNRFFNPRHAVDLFYKNYVLRFLPDTSVQYSTTSAENNEVICKFKIGGYCPDPLFSESTDSKVIAADITPAFHFPLAMSQNPNPPGGVVFGVKRPGLIMSVYNSGAVDVGMRIVFSARGTVINPAVIDIGTQKFFKINKVMIAGEEIAVNTVIGSKRITGTLNGETSNYFKYRDLDSEWLQLKVGDNLLRYNASDGLENLEVTIYHNNRYLEVQECY